MKKILLFSFTIITTTLYSQQMNYPLDFLPIGYNTKHTYKIAQSTRLFL
jgi:hypothetical protein